MPGGQHQRLGRRRGAANDDPGQRVVAAVSHVDLVTPRHHDDRPRVVADPDGRGHGTGSQVDDVDAAVPSARCRLRRQVGDAVADRDALNGDSRQGNRDTVGRRGRAGGGARGPRHGRQAQRGGESGARRQSGTCLSPNTASAHRKPRFLGLVHHRPASHDVTQNAPTTRHAAVQKTAQSDADPYRLSRVVRALRRVCSGPSGRDIERQAMNLSGRTRRAPSSSISRTRAQS